MQLLLDIVLYALGAVMLLVGVAAFLGFASGWIAWVQSWREEKECDHSDLFADIDARRRAFEASRTTKGEADPPMIRVVYPSRAFDKETEGLLKRGERFFVAVPARSRKRAAVVRELPAMVHFHPGRGKLFGEFFDKLRLMGLWKCIAVAVMHYQYLVIYDVAADITIRFEPKPPPERK